MRRNWFLSLIVVVLLLVGVSGVTARHGEPAPAAPQSAVGAAFTYQGQIESGGNPVNGTCDFQFALYDAASGGTQIGTIQTTGNVTVTNGLFTVALDFGNAFNGDARWLEMAVRCPVGSGGYTTLTPRQALTPAPYALALPGLVTQQNLTSTNIIGGYSGNYVSPGVVGATIGGGGSNTQIHQVTSNYGTIGGGISNYAGGPLVTIGGGQLNNASGDDATIGGGFTNAALGNGSTVSGGDNNTATGIRATVSGGGWNVASGWGAIAAGGSGNVAAGDYSFAAGRRARANNTGDYVWGDSTDADINSSGANQFIVRANGGMWVGQTTTNYTPTIGANVMISTSTGAYLSSDGTWVNSRPYKTPQQIAMLKWYTAISTTQSSFAVGAQPCGVAFDGANIWVANSNWNSVSVLRASDGSPVATYTGIVDPDKLAYDGVNMWVSNCAANTVSVIRAQDGFRVMTPTVGSCPQGIAFDGTNMWVANGFTNTVSVLRASDGYHVMTLTMSVAGPDIAFDGVNMWVTNYSSNSVSVIRASDGFRVMTVTTPTPQGIAFDGINMWVGNFAEGSGNTVSVFRVSDGALVRTVTVGPGPRGVAFDGTNIWVANQASNTVSVLRASDGALVATVPVGANPWGMAFDGAYMWIANYGDGTVSKR